LSLLRNRSELFTSTKAPKTVRFSESNTYQNSPSRPSDDYSPGDILSQQQQMMLDQDESLDRLSDSIGRQRELSIQIGDELDSQGELLEDVDGIVDRSRSRLDGARRRLNRFSNKAKDNGIPFVA
jgi:syntaxin 8